MTRNVKTLAVAAEVAEVLGAHGVRSAVIGALAVAAHGFPRATEDADLATDTDPFTKLRDVAGELRGRGYEVEQRDPDAEDPLGGLLRIEGPDFDPIEVVNYYNPFGGGSALGGEAVRAATEFLEGTTLKLVPLPHLIALKLYAGGSRSKLDVIELIQRNPALDLPATRDICRRYDLLPALEAILAELGRG